MKLYAIFDKDGNATSHTFSSELDAWMTTWFTSDVNEGVGVYKARMESEGYTCEEVEIRKVQK